MKKNRLRTLLISAFVVIAAAVVMLGAIVALRRKDTLEVNEPVYIVMNGQRVEFDTGIKLKHNKNGTVLVSDGHDLSLEEQLVINEGEKSLMLQKSGSYNRSDDDGIMRADYYTKVVKDGSTVHFERNGKRLDDVNGVLYDNADTYIFLEPVTVTWGENVKNIDAGTAVQVSYLKYIQFYGVDIQTEFYECTEMSVYAEFSNGKRVNMATDRFYQNNGTWRLMYLPLDTLKNWQ